MAANEILIAPVFIALRDRLALWANASNVVILDPYAKESITPKSRYVFMQLVAPQSTPTIDLSQFERKGFAHFNLGVPKGVSEYNLLKLGDELAGQFPAGLTIPIGAATLTVMQPSDHDGQTEEFNNFLTLSLRVQIQIS